jgi:alkanesulfonate monooxygenase SsuD/methylene tetrahydromethanopterin reductase-like flavin-dependent oxidoreductase (luciferase family)
MLPEFGIFDILQTTPERSTGEFLAEHLGHLRLADELGLDYIFVAERHFMPFYRAATPGLLLAHLAATTTRARLGVLAYTLALHHPAFLAEEISALDYLSGGRLEVGVGLGHRPQEISSVGLPAEHRQALFLEVLLLLRRLWQGDPVAHDGVLYHLRDVLIDRPLQQPHPPLWYAGSDPAAAGWAARNGLSLAIGFQPDDGLLAPADAFRAARAAQSSGAEPGTSRNERGPADTRLAIMRHVYVAESDERAHEQMVDDLLRLGADLAANPRDVPDAPSTPPTRASAERQLADMLAKQVVVAGGAARVANEISTTLRRLDADVFLANVHLQGVDDASVRASLTRFAREVVPAVRTSGGQA